MSIFGLIGGVASGIMSMKAAKTQARAVRQGIAEQRRQFDQSREDMLPWMEAGQRSLADLETELGSEYEQSKGYQWQVDEGEKRTRSNLAALGMTGSGSALKRLTEWGQGLAAQDYDKWFGRKQQMAGQGQQQSQSLGQLGANYGTNVANSYNLLGAVRGSGYAGIGNAISNYTEQQSKLSGANAGYGGLSNSGDMWAGLRSVS